MVPFGLVFSIVCVNEFQKKPIGIYTFIINVCSIRYIRKCLMFKLIKRIFMIIGKHMKVAKCDDDK